MSNNAFVKGACRLCGGHLEFPAAAAGQTIACPHCGQPTLLAATAANGLSPRRRLVIVCGTLCCIAGAAAALLGHHGPPPVSTNLAAHAVAPVASIPAKPPGAMARPGEWLTNNFGITGGHLRKTPGSSLVYVTGTVRNPTDHQRFGVKVDYTLFDSHDILVGHATDYQSMIDPRGEWNFQAMVMEARAASARFSSITEQ